VIVWGTIKAIGSRDLGTPEPHSAHSKPKKLAISWVRVHLGATFMTLAMHPRIEDDKLRRIVADLSSRAQSTLISWNSQVRERADARRQGATTAEAHRIVEEDKLRLQLVELEKESLVVEEEYRAKEAEVSRWEQRAEVAMRHSDTLAADEALRAHAEQSVSLKALERELTILRALMRACREALS
jgi:hypothetical protein